MSISLGIPHMRKRDECEAVELGRKILGPCGDLPTERLDWGSQGVHVVHVRRALRDDEAAHLPDWFLSCPAIDMAGMRPLVL